MLLGAFLDLWIEETLSQHHKEKSVNKKTVKETTTEKIISAVLRFLNSELVKLKKILHPDHFQLNFQYQQCHGIRGGLFQVELRSQRKIHPINFRQIKSAIIEKNSQLSPTVVKTALAIFSEIADAEAKIHHCLAEDVHFHEIGGIDSIVDIVAAAIMIEKLQIEEIHCSAINLGSGIVETDHGLLPIPAPATCEILRNIPVYGESLNQELCTPTGAGIVKICVKKFGPLPNMKILHTGYGAGTHPLPRANLLRVFLGHSLPTKMTYQHSNDKEIAMKMKNIPYETLNIVSANIDDMTAEHLSLISEQCLELGALDVWLAPIIMKKGRPAHQISLICKSDNQTKFVDFLFRETSSLGVRSLITSRYFLPREMKTFETAYGKIDFKIAKFLEQTNVKPEHESIAKISKKRNIPYHLVHRYAQKFILEHIQNHKKKDEIE